ncbi:MAG: class I SAM-dependent methyltransferase [Acidobacteriota bacterium]
MTIEWRSGRTRADCPACGSSGDCVDVLVADSVVPKQARITLLRCPECGVGFLRDPVAPRYEEATEVAAGMSVDYYVEQGAGVDAMASLLQRLTPRMGRRFLEIGCGYGFALDFARSALRWTVQGVDPSPLAAAGSVALELPIARAYLDEETPIGDQFDVVLASEVLEHLDDPGQLLRSIRQRMASRGILVLTTPNLAAVLPSTAESVLGRLLSPGFHLVMFDREALQSILLRSGFAVARVEESAHSLVAFASPAPEGLAEVSVGPRQEDRGSLRGYLAARAETAAPSSALASGFAYRHFKECVNAGLYREARESRLRLAVVYRERYGLELEGPVAVDLGSNGIRPFNLTGVHFFSGMLELNDGAAGERAADHFAAAIAAANETLSNQRSLGLCDGETEDLRWQSRRHLALAWAASSPERALGALGDLAGATAEDGAAPGDVEATRASTFVRLVNAGAHDAAESLAETVAAELGLDALDSRAGGALPTRAALDALYCLAMLHLQRDRWTDAAALFALTVRLAERGSDSAADLIDLARAHEQHARALVKASLVHADRMAAS